MSSERCDRAETCVIAELIDACKLEIGDGYRAKNSELGAEGLPFARAGNINSGFDFSTADRVPPVTLAKVGRKRSMPGDVVFTSKGTVGRFAWVRRDTEPFVYSPQLCFWRSLDPDSVDPRFLYYWMQGPECLRQINALKGQTDMADYVSLRDQRTMKITLPPLAVQQKIARVLGSLDDKIESNHAACRLLHEVAEQAYRRALSTAQVARLGDLGTIRGGGTPKSSVTSYWEPADVAWITVKDMTALAGSPVIWRGERNISQLGLQKSSAKLLPAGTVLYTSRATLGMIAIAQQELSTNQDFITIEPAPGLSSELVYFTLRANRDAIAAKANGSTFLAVNKTNFKAVECRIPDEGARAAFQAVAGPAFRLIAGLTQEAQRLRAVRDVLLPKLVSGQIRVPAGVEPRGEAQAADLVESTA